MNRETLALKLENEGIVTLEAAQWARLSDQFEVIEVHDTCLAGDLRIVSTSAGPAAVEQPRPDRRVVRLLGSDAEVRRFVQQRLETYDRMWDGCGCKIDYYG